ncbi:MAG: hypothetical protein PHQ40_04780 [Anaerolineaceae bacterium]|nr:hypothetical protein [Anaerolineaceae bacterium]
MKRSPTKPNALMICGSLNQTTMLHQISQNLKGFNCSFTPFYADGLLESLTRLGFLNFTILGGAHRQATEAYLERERLPIDYGGQARDYDVVFTGTDVFIQQNIRGKRLILIQEGMIEPERLLFPLVKRGVLPRFIADTAATGLSDAYDIFCVASTGYRELFLQKGIRPEKMIVTGIPNFDNAAAFLDNDFPYRHYVLAATSSLRETLKRDNRLEFLRRVRQVADGRPVIFKLHPNENHSLATGEVRSLFPSALVLTGGDIRPMIANCDVLMTQASSVVFYGLALGKEVYSNFDVQQLRILTPIQNGGSSAARIAEVGVQLLRTGTSGEYLQLPRLQVLG